jgi:hypothetical protein
MTSATITNKVVISIPAYGDVNSKEAYAIMFISICDISVVSTWYSGFPPTKAKIDRHDMSNIQLGVNNYTLCRHI